MSTKALEKGILQSEKGREKMKDKTIGLWMISPMIALLIASVVCVYRDLSKLSPLWSFVFLFSTFFFSVGIIHIQQHEWVKNED
jgi:hypothetical protein